MGRVNMLFIACILCMLFPGSSGLALRSSSLAGVIGGSVVAFILVIAIVIMCALILMKSRLTNPPQPTGPGRFAPRGNPPLNPAPDTVSYNQPRTTVFPRSNLQSLTDSGNVYLGNTFVGDQGINNQESAWAQADNYQVNGLDGGQIINNQQPIQIQEMAVNLGLDQYNSSYL